MQRTGSTARATEEHFVGLMVAGTLPSAGGVAPPPGIQTRRLSAVEGTAESDSLLPKYDPQSTFAKKEAARSRTAESAIHLIPVILIVCAFILWFFSNPRISLVSSVVPVIEPAAGRGKDTHPPPIVGLAAAGRSAGGEDKMALTSGGGGGGGGGE